MEDITLSVTSNQADLTALIDQINTISAQIAAFKLVYSVAPVTPMAPEVPPVA